ncbi:GreA/GreB family elongation factor [Mobilitalea sibirica]|uniref:Transcription elongation factor GreA n=1 Tax=Mobilitalea sibirica TaxID=1462919 RepID=A0A8J7H4C7_9FIRM|nr:GreA/GreB family elongation factor [Mobilitalea sibirica]MBH1942165.1 GreA/GreB family elongation factor [Mobilitalea sibirica]
MYDKITQKDVKRMEEEIEHRILVVRPDTLKDVKEARAHGDLSENFEYKAAKKAQRENESRIRYLKRMIKTAQIVSEESNQDEVGLNDAVTIYYPDDGEEETVKIVTTVRSNSLKGRIGMDSPLGKALMRRRVMDKVSVKVDENYSYEVVIRKIEKLEDDGEDEMRKY